jgi:hypothetical protein
MTNQNELATQNQNEVTTQDEVLETSIVVSETEDYTVFKDQNGKFTRKAKFREFSSIVPQNRKEKIWLLGLLEGDEETGNGLKSHVGKQIEVQDIITRKYDKINEETGQKEYGVLTYLITPDRIAYVTSSKSVYFTITRIMELFGQPGTPEWENVVIKVGKEKGANGDMIKIKMVG